MGILNLTQSSNVAKQVMSELKQASLSQTKWEICCLFLFAASTVKQRQVCECALKVHMLGVCVYALMHGQKHAPKRESLSCSGANKVCVWGCVSGWYQGSRADYSWHRLIPRTLLRNMALQPLSFEMKWNHSRKAWTFTVDNKNITVFLSWWRHQLTQFHGWKKNNNDAFSWAQVAAHRKRNRKRLKYLLLLSKTQTPSTTHAAWAWNIWVHLSQPRRAAGPLPSRVAGSEPASVWVLFIVPQRRAQICQAQWLLWTISKLPPRPSARPVTDANSITEPWLLMTVDGTSYYG